MQGGGRPGLRILAGAADLVSIDARPLMLAFAICGGAPTVAAFAAWLAAGHAAKCEQPGQGSGQAAVNFSGE